VRVSVILSGVDAAADETAAATVAAPRAAAPAAQGRPSSGFLSRFM